MHRQCNLRKSRYGSRKSSLGVKHNTEGNVIFKEDEIM